MPCRAADRIRNAGIYPRSGIAPTGVKRRPIEYTLTEDGHAETDMVINITEFGKSQSPYGYGHEEHGTHNPFRGTTTPIISLDNNHNTWKGLNVRLEDFDHDRSGRFTGGSSQVLCDSDLCACRELYDSPRTEFIETHLFCDGSFTQQKVDPVDDSIRDPYAKTKKHNVFLKACGHGDCTTCGGSKELNLMVAKH